VSFPDLPFPLATAAGRGVVREAASHDAIVVDSIAAAFAAPWLPQGTPTLGMLHQGPGGIDHGWARTRIQARLDRWAYSRMRVLLAASESLAVELRPLHPEVRVVPPGRDVAATAEPHASDLRRGRAAAFLCVANWTRRKGVVELLDAFARLPEALATLHLVGDESVEPRYRSAVRRRLGELGDRVIVHGVVAKERVASLYRDADVFVMASTKEPYGTVYGEAMAAGLPVVGWRAGNLPHLADDGREGILMTRGDVEGLAAALGRLAGDPALRSRMAEAAKRRAADFPTWRETAAAFFREVRQVAAG